MTSKHQHFHASTASHHRNVPKALVFIDGTLRCPFASCRRTLPAHAPGYRPCACGKLIRIPQLFAPKVVGPDGSLITGETREDKEIRLRLKLPWLAGYRWHNELVA